MSRLFLFAFALILAACAKCYDGKFSETTVTNLSSADRTITVCREDSLTTTQDISLVSNQILTFQWGSPEEIHNSTDMDGQCPATHNDEHDKIAIRLTTTSQALVRLCLKTSGDYEIEAAADPCPSGETEVTDACP